MSSAAVMIGALRVNVEALTRYVLGANSALFLRLQNHLQFVSFFLNNEQK